MWIDISCVGSSREALGGGVRRRWRRWRRRSAAGGRGHMRTDAHTPAEAAAAAAGVEATGVETDEGDTGEEGQEAVEEEEVSATRDWRCPRYALLNNHSLSWISF